MNDPEKIEDLIEQLGNFRSRSRAIRRVVERGDEAVEPLIDALHRENQEGTRWAILRCLGELGAEEAVGHIAPLLQERQYRSAAHDALIEIVGDDLGPAPQPWLRWAQDTSLGRPSSTVLDPQMHMTGLPDERLLALALKGSEATWTQEAEGRYAVKVPVEDQEEPQDLTITLAQQDHEGSPIVIAYADCGEASEKHYADALERNLRMPYGAIGLRRSGSSSRFVMFNTLLREDMSPLELQKSILAIAERAARVRRELQE